MTFRTSAVAVCWARDAASSRVSSAISALRAAIVALTPFPPRSDLRKRLALFDQSNSLTIIHHRIGRCISGVVGQEEAARAYGSTKSGQGTMVDFTVLIAMASA